MDKTIRRNENCIVGLPRCDFVFSSTRTCFIAYGFEESPLEMSLLKKILEAKGISPIEAGGSLAPAQNAFCTKICSKIITSQFCIILLNNDTKDGQEIPNANVNMEYGLMLGFNKYVIPFQKGSQKLPFNVAGLDTLKYSNSDFERLATKAIEQAIEETEQKNINDLNMDQNIETFLLTKKALMTHVDSGPGERDIFRLGAPFRFNLLNDFSGMNYMYFGNFTAFRPDTAIKRVSLLVDVLNSRKEALSKKVSLGILTEESASQTDRLIDDMKIWLLVTSDEDKSIISKEIEKLNMSYDYEVYSIGDVKSSLSIA